MRVQRVPSERSSPTSSQPRGARLEGPEADRGRALRSRIDASERGGQQRARFEAQSIVQRKEGASTPAAMKGESGESSESSESSGATGLPPQLKSNVEAMSGFSLDSVRVHFGSSRPAQIHALAYTQGTQIHLGPGQDRHLAHEAWHVVQQAQGRVCAQRQMKSGVAVNEDRSLEHEADVMAERAERPSPRPANLRPIERVASVAQMVRGGLEFTEDDPARLRSYRVPALGAAAVNRSQRWDIEGSDVSAFVVANAAALGALRNVDRTLLDSGHVKLTNDVRSAEWVIARHGADVAADVMHDNLENDIAQMFTMRSALVDNLTALENANPGRLVAMVPGNVATLHTAPDPQGVFTYVPGTSKGKAQITAQYTNLDTIRRINKLNLSKFLRGTKVAQDEDVPRVAGTESEQLQAADRLGTTSFSQADALLQLLVGTSVAITDAVTGAQVLSANQVALIKLMVINDALTTTMVRYAARLGQAQEKNLQRFFPKSRRDEYTKTVAGAVVNAANMVLLRAEINRTAAADAALVHAQADAGALRVDEAFAAIGAADARIPAMIAARQAMNADPPRLANAQAVADIKDVVLGVNGATLATWIGRAANAYTDTSAGGDDQYQGAPPLAGPDNRPGNVIRSTAGFTPVAGANPGAIYEFRERETPAEQDGWIFGGHDELSAALDALFAASV